MEEIGRTLKNRRERLGLTLEEVERSTRIRTNRLEALEAGEFDTLPSEVQLRGFLRNYADFLGLEPEDILESYEASSGGKRKPRLRLSRSQPGMQPSSKPGSLRHRSITEWVLSGVIVVAVSAVFIWGLGSIVASLNTAEPTVVPQALVAIDDSTEIPTSTGTPETQLSLQGVAVTALADTEGLPTPTLILPVLDAVRLQLTAT
ncbi:MAG: helix-turn-helix domain-containing protein, partial [Anaerolineales bacterium]